MAIDHYTDKFALLDAMVAGGFHMLPQQHKMCSDKLPEVSPNYRK